MARRGRWFPALVRAETKDMPSGGVESKVLLESYYATLAAAGVTLPGKDRHRPWGIERAVAEGYERIVWIFKPVDVIASNQAGLRYLLRSGEDEVDDHPLYRLLNKQANPMEDARTFRKRLSAQVSLSDRGAFVEVGMSNGQTPKRLDLLPPGRTRPVPGDGKDPDRPISHFEVTPVGGGRPRTIEVEKVRWIRDPHPLNAYAAQTPLTAAGLSIRLDDAARIFNVSFMENDGRPGGILGVKAPPGEGPAGDIDPEEAARLESRFGRGPSQAGKLSVISGELSYVDVAARPRDMQYVQTSRNAKIEMLVAYGVPESQMGNAADRTFANASEEGLAFWTQTMRNHNSIILSGFERDSGDDLTGDFDTSHIEVLQRAKALARQEAREEVAAGLRSPWSYAVLADRGDEIQETPQTRALYFPSASKIIIPATEEDAQALAPPAAPGTEPAPDPEVEGEDAAAGETLPAADEVLPAADQEAVSEPTADGSLVQGKAWPRLSVVPSPPVRHVLAIEHKADSVGASAESTLADALREETESEVARLLADVEERQVERAIARLRSPQQRKGTRHFTPEYPVDTRVGEKALDAARISGEDPSDEEQAKETSEVEAALTAAAAAAAAAMLADLGQPETEALPDKIVRRITTTVTGAMRFVRDSLARQRRLIADKINLLDQAGRSIDEIVTALRDRETAWPESLSVQATTATLEGARADVAVVLNAQQVDIRRTWLSRRDDLVRDSHDKADGQRRDIGKPFLVGRSLLRYPGDPLAPVEETANCRCRLVYTSKTTGRFVGGALDTKALPKTQKCKYCTAQATKRIIHSEGMAYIPVCPAHLDKGKRDAAACVPSGKPDPSNIDAVRDIPEVKHLPGKHDQGSHGNRFGVGANGKREMTKAGRARLYGVTPPPRLGARATEAEIAKSEQGQREYDEALEILSQMWSDDPADDVTPEDLEQWRAEWVDEFPETPADDDTDYEALDAAFLNGWHQEWVDAEWRVQQEEKRQAAFRAMEEAATRGVDTSDEATRERQRARAERNRRGRSESNLRRDYDTFVQAQYAQAVRETNAAIYSKAGKQAADANLISDFDLFRGKLTAKYASEELLTFWASNPRLTFTEYRTQALGRDSDLRRKRK